MALLHKRPNGFWRRFFIAVQVFVDGLFIEMLPAREAGFEFLLFEFWGFEKDPLQHQIPILAVGRLVQKRNIVIPTQGIISRVEAKL
ncbi:MAG: hypothetical protein WBY69_14010 [Candidatus Acidiferrales bacterium]